MEYRTILTDAGLAAVAAAAQAGDQVQITHLAMGDGGGMEYAPDSAQTSLKNERWRGAVASYTRDGNRFTVTAHMPAETQAFVVRELALFLSDGTCFAVANAPSVPHQPPVNGVGTEFETIMPFAVENADSVTVAVDPTGGIPWSMVGAPNGVAGLDETGKLPERYLPDLDFNPSGSAAAVQQQLEAHTASKNNPHGVTAAQVGAFTKAQTLTAETAALFGLGADATPNSVLAQIKTLLNQCNAAADAKTISELKSYVGTGTYGASNPTSLSFSFTPLFVIFIGYYAPKAFGVGAFDNPYSGLWMIPVSSLSTAYRQYFGFCLDNTSSAYGKRSADSNTAYWYNTSNATEQLNASGQTYYFLAIGRK